VWAYKSEKICICPKPHNYFEIVSPLGKNGQQISYMPKGLSPLASALESVFDLKVLPPHE
ncbi:MAG: hypothetical protein Q4G58_00760, partial [bacterium]|nr:hypothetical protein [bacterium]